MPLLTHGMVISKTGILRRNDNIATHSNLKATSHRRALDTADDGHK